LLRVGKFRSKHGQDQQNKLPRQSSTYAFAHHLHAPVRSALIASLRQLPASVFDP
jgi:hypothetical protein